MAGAAKTPTPAARSRKRPRRASLAGPPRDRHANGSAEGARLSTADVRRLLTILRELKKGNLSVRMPIEANGTAARVALELNAVIELFAEAQEASRSKSAFLSMAAHELHTPLSVVIGYLSMLQDGSLPPDRWQGALRVLVEKARELNNLVNDLLMAARIEGGTVPTEVATLDVREVTRQAIARADARASLLRGEVLFEEPPTPVLVEADREQLGRIVDNLINNALTYTTDPPWVRITVTDGELASVTVEDNGIGIPVELRERIFERFFRIDDPAVGPQPGTGLGLYISRELAERHGGSLVLDRSELGKGSTFVLRLPAPAGTERPVAVVSGPVVAAALEQLSTP